MTPILLSDLVRIVVPEPQAILPFDQRALGDLREKSQKLIVLCLQHGVLGHDDAKDFGRESSDLIDRIEDVQNRLLLRESIDREDVWDLRYKWKDGLTDFLRFRDLVRDTLNTLMRGRLISASTGDAIKVELDRFFLQVNAVDDAVQGLLKQL